METGNYFFRAWRIVFSDRSVWWRIAVLAVFNMVPILGSIVFLGYTMILMRDVAWESNTLPTLSRRQEIATQGLNGFGITLLWTLPLSLAFIIAIAAGLGTSAASGDAASWGSLIISVPAALLTPLINLCVLRAAVYVHVSAGLSPSGLRSLVRLNPSGFRQVAFASLLVSCGTLMLSQSRMLLPKATTSPLMQYGIELGFGFVLAALVSIPLMLVVACSYGLWASSTHPASWPPLRAEPTVNLREAAAQGPVGDDAL